MYKKTWLSEWCSISEEDFNFKNAHCLNSITTLFCTSLHPWKQTYFKIGTRHCTQECHKIILMLLMIIENQPDCLCHSSKKLQCQNDNYLCTWTTS